MSKGEEREPQYNIDTPREPLTQYYSDPMTKYPPPLQPVFWPLSFSPFISVSPSFSPSLWPDPPASLSLCGILNLFIIKSTSSLSPCPLPRHPFLLFAHLPTVHRHSLFLFLPVYISNKYSSQGLLSPSSALDFEQFQSITSLIQICIFINIWYVTPDSVKHPKSKVLPNLSLYCCSAVLFLFWSCYKWLSLRDLVNQSSS